MCDTLITLVMGVFLSPAPFHTERILLSVVVMSWRTRILKFLGVLVMTLNCASSSRSADQSALESALICLVKQVELGAVESVDILYVPTTAMFSVGFTSETLKRDYWYRVSIRVFELSREQQQLVVDLKRTSVEPSKVSGNLRWGLILRIRGTRPLDLGFVHSYCSRASFQEDVRT